MSAPVVELVYFEGCPHVQAARDALASAGTTWREWLTEDPALPAYARGYASPSIFVARREITGAGPGATGNACRIYTEGGRLVGAPDAAAIAAAIREAKR